MKMKPALYLGLFLFLVSCYPGGIDYYEETDIIYTNYEAEFDFTGQSTYAMPDRIVKITGNLLEGEDPEFINEPYNTQMVNRIQSNMSALGWTLVEDPAVADVVLFPAAWSNTTVYYWYDYWCWYYYYYCGWGGWGYSYPTVSSYTTGTLVMTLVANDASYVEPPKVWISAANGLLSGANDIDRVNDVIDQTFEQSPYLNIN
jgi:Domain of unknown function (DUF4136)